MTGPRVTVEGGKIFNLFLACGEDKSKKYVNQQISNVPVGGSLKGNGDSQKIQVTQLDIAGKFISPFAYDFMRNFPNIIVDSAAKFSTGSAAYKMTMTPLQDQYSIGSGGFYSQLSSFATIDAIIDYLTTNQLQVGMYDSVKMVDGTSPTATKGDLQLFSYGKLIPQNSATWEKKIVKNQEILIIHIPSILRTVSMNPNAPDGNPDEDVIYGLVNTTVMKGSVRYANIPRQEKGFNFNTTAFNDMLTKFLLGV